MVLAKIASLYFPLLGIVMDAYAQLFDPYGQRTKSGSSSVQSAVAADDEHVLEGYIAPGLNPNVAMVLDVSHFIYK